MEIKLTPKESEEYFHNALCNIGGMLRSSGIEIDWNETDYKRAKRSLQKKVENKEITLSVNNTICIEDVLVEILRIGKKLKANDVDGDGEHNRTITLADVHTRVEKTPINHLTDMISENDDAYTADAILQTVFFGSVIFG